MAQTLTLVCKSSVPLGSHTELTILFLSKVLHQYFLSLFGLNIGELWDLKALGHHCKAAGRYEFLLTSIPLNVAGLVGSPPNALAHF
jgi:hypothetical protein